MFENLHVILTRTKYPENIGSVARACVNMGCPNLTLVKPQDLNLERAEPLATVKGKNILANMHVVDNLEEALNPFHKTYATTARVGGWRKGILTAEKAARQITDELQQGFVIGVVFGPEDTGLSNEETTICSQLISIPTVSNAWSLNLAQAVLIVLYECFKLCPCPRVRPIYTEHSKPATQEEIQTLFNLLRKVLLDVDFLKSDNPDYFMLPLKRFINRRNIRRNEFNLLMGICRQISWLKSQLDDNRGPLKS